MMRSFRRSSAPPALLSPNTRSVAAVSEEAAAALALAETLSVQVPTALSPQKPGVSSVKPPAGQAMGCAPS